MRYAIKTILDIARDLKMVIFPCKVRFLCLQICSTFSILVTVSVKFFSFFIVSLYEKWMPKTFIVFWVKSTGFSPQSALETPFRFPIPAISHFEWLGFRSEYSENFFIMSRLVLGNLQKSFCDILHYLKLRKYVYCILNVIYKKI